MELTRQFSPFPGSLSSAVLRGRMVDLAKLFQRVDWAPRLFPYKSWRAELDAVESGRKAMSKTHVFRSDIPAGHELRELLADALDRDLFLVFATDEQRNLRHSYEQVTIYVTRADQLWRIPAHRALWQTAFVGGSWSDASEALEGLLLGYTAAERQRWIAARRQRAAADGCGTVYTIVSRDQRRAIDAAGRRYLGDTTRLTLFVHGDGWQLRPDAPRLVPPGTTLARMGVAWDVYWRLFGRASKRGHRRPGVNTAAIPTKLAPAFHAAMRSNVQFLTRRGWG